MSEQAAEMTPAQLHARILEWEDCYDRLAGAFDLHMDILECKQALSDYAGVFYDVVLGEAHAEIARLRSELAWYADKSNYDSLCAPRANGVNDLGRHARLALEKET